MKLEVQKPGDGAKRWWSGGADRYAPLSAATLGPAHALVHSAWYVQLAVLATAAGLAAPTRCSAWPARSGGPDVVPDREEKDGSRPGQGKVGVPCTSLYKGESGYSAFVRGLGHKQDEEASRQTNAMVRHNTLYHKGEQVDYQMSVISTHNKPVGRRLREGVEIVSGNQTILLNSKEEFLKGAVPSTRTQRGFGQ